MAKLPLFLADTDFLDTMVEVTQHQCKTSSIHTAALAQFSHQSNFQMSPASKVV